MHTIIKVMTRSGSSYMLEQKGNELFIQKGTLFGRVVTVYEEIKIGGILHLDFVKTGMSGTSDSSPMFLRSTTITDISVVIW